MLKIVRCLLKSHDSNYFQLCYLKKLNTKANNSFVQLESKLINRLFFYLKNDAQQKIKKHQESEGLILELLNKHCKDFKKYDTHTLLSAFNSLAERHIIKDETTVHTIVNTLDNEFCQRINDLTNSEILCSLCLFMRLMPNGIIDLNYYKQAIKYLMQNNLDRNDLIQLIFFIGLMKKSNVSTQMLRECMKLFNKDFINSLTTEEICIICNATFKTSTKIKNLLFLDKIMKYLSDNLYLLKDTAIFITMLKTIRHNRYQNDDLLTTISCTIFFNKTIHHYSFPAICHILALYSDCLHYDENLLGISTNRCVELLKEAKYISKSTYLLQQPRLKDIKRLLWCLSNMNSKHLTKCDIENVIIPQIIGRIKAGEVKRDILSLVEICLYLWMLEYKAYELIEHCFTKENLTLIRSK